MTTAMRVALNAEPMLRRTPTGVGIYTLSLCRAFAALGRAEQIALFHAARDEVAPEVDSLGMERAAFPLDRDTLYRYWGTRRRPTPQSVLGGLDVVHAPGPAVPPPGRARLVATIHDLAFLRLDSVRATAGERSAQVRDDGLRNAAREAARIICPSAHTAADVVELLGVAAERVQVVPQGVDLPHVEREDADATLHRLGVQQPYVLWVGTQEPRKNLRTVIDAFAGMRRRDVQLVLHGPGRWLGDAVEERSRRRRVSDRVTKTGPLPRRDLAALYARASAFVYPSLYEGFGLPVLEAMAAGTPVVTSTTSSLPECAGDAGILCDPVDDVDVARALDQVLDDPGLAEEMRRRGHARAARFTWEETARRTFAIYEEAARA